MKDYTKILQDHLTAYARSDLGITEPGHWRGHPYSHILPRERRELNLLPHCRSGLLAHLAENPRIKLHEYFHHLSSSQAFAFNLFFPFLTCDPLGAASFFAHFGSEPPDRWNFEFIPDPIEGTNVDVAWTAREGGTLYCEVKLTESEFGSAKDLPKYQTKLDTIYRDRLSSLVPAKYLEPKVFRAHYQILRNLALLSRGPRDRVVFLLPRENESVKRKLEPVLDDLRPEVRSRVRKLFIEDLVEALKFDTALPQSLRDHVAAVKAKYVPLHGDH